MSGACSHQLEVDAWQRLGAAATLPDALERHLLECPPCHAHVAEVRALRGLFAHLPAIEIEQQQLDEMRFLLMAEARRGPAPLASASTERHYPRWLRRHPFFGFSAAVVFMVSAAAAFSAVRSDWEREQGLERERLSTLPRPRASSAERREPGPAALHPANPEAAAASAPHVEAPGTKAASPRDLAPRATATSEPVRALRRGLVAASARRPVDERFRRARALIGDGRAAEAVEAFDRLADDPTVDAARRADALFWAARASRDSGDAQGARARAEQYLAAHPNGWYRARAAALR